MTTETIVVDTTAQDLIIEKITESRNAVLEGIDKESVAATMYDRGVSDALSAVTTIGTVSAAVVVEGSEGHEKVVQLVDGPKLIESFWAKVNN